MTAKTHQQVSAQATEIEGKYPVADFDAVLDALRDAGAVFCGAAVEHDTFYDHADGRLASAGAVCRLRRFEILDDADPPMDPRPLLTYKGAVLPGAVKCRPESETRLDDAAAIDTVLRATGMTVVQEIRKNRALYQIGPALIALDTALPAGRFVEIEAPSEDRVHALRDQLGITSAHVTAGYPTLLR
jgi:predicted adenylyl cyclase CyaB